MIVFRGDARLRAEVLAQMERHRVAGCLDDVVIAGHSLYLYGDWGRATDFVACERVLGLPQALLRLGWCLFDGFPENEAGARDLVTTRARFMAALPLGHDLRPLPARFLAGLILDPELGAGRDDDFAEAALAVATALEPGGHGTEATALDNAATAAAALYARVEREAYPQPQRAGGATQPAAYERLRAAELLVAGAEYAGGDATAAARAVLAAAHGAHGVAADDTRLERIADRLLVRLSAAV